MNNWPEESKEYYAQLLGFLASADDERVAALTAGFETIVSNERMATVVGAGLSFMRMIYENADSKQRMMIRNIMPEIFREVDSEN